MLEVGGTACLRRPSQVHAHLIHHGLEVTTPASGEYVVSTLMMSGGLNIRCSARLQTRGHIDVPNPVSLSNNNVCPTAMFVQQQCHPGS